MRELRTENEKPYLSADYSVRNPPLESYEEEYLASYHAEQKERPKILDAFLRYCKWLFSLRFY